MQWVLVHMDVLRRQQTSSCSNAKIDGAHGPAYVVSAVFPKSQICAWFIQLQSFKVVCGKCRNLILLRSDDRRLPPYPN